MGSRRPAFVLKALFGAINPDERAARGAQLFTDGAIQGFTAKLKPPGYFRGEDHGMWNMEEDHFRAAVMGLHKAGVKTHIHTNDDTAPISR